MVFQNTDFTLFHTNSLVVGIFHIFRYTTAHVRSQMAISGSRYLKLTQESNFSLVLKNLGIFRVRNWSNLGEIDENPAYHPPKLHVKAYYCPCSINNGY